MRAGPTIDGQLVQWGERLFYPGNRIVRPDLTPRLDTLNRRKAAVIRHRIAAVVRRAPQVIVKIVSGGRGMRPITAQFQYVTRGGRLEFEDDRGVRRGGSDAVRHLAHQWRLGGSLIEDVSDRYEALYVTMAMPRGTDPALLLDAARAVAKAEMAGNRYIMVLHAQQAHPHVHFVVRAQSRTGERLNPFLDRHRWRERFAQELRLRGIDADATRQSTRGENRFFVAPWDARSPKSGDAPPKKSGERHLRQRAEMMRAWSHLMKVLSVSPLEEDRQLAERVAAFIGRTPVVADAVRRRDLPPRTSEPPQQEAGRSEGRPSFGPGLDRTR